MTDAHPESYCHRCGGPNVSWAAPSPLWNAVMRGNDINASDDFNGIICPTCFAGLAAERVGAKVWRFSPERVEAPLVNVTPSGRVWNADAWLWVDSGVLRGQPCDRCPAGVPEEKTRFGVCGNEREPDGEVCTEVLYYASGEVQVKCPRCGAWQGIHSRPWEVSGD